ncbi:MAG: DUF4412 domain-containing protein [Lewinella sp.]|nr:DUF4412 domain-containing protein [Lewinella sp.]
MSLRINLFKHFLTIVLCLSAILVAEAQNPISNRIRNRVNQRINREIDKAVDQAIDEALSPEERADSIAQAEQQQDSMAQAYPTATMSSGEWEPYQNPYPISFDMDMTTTKREREESYHIEYTIDTWHTGMRMTQDDGSVMRLILDNQAGTVTTVMEKDGDTPQAFRMRQRKYDVSDVTPDEDKITVTRTGNTRTIDGYHCEEYLIEHDNGTTNAWVTEEVDMDYIKLMSGFVAQSRGGQSPMANDGFYGVTGFPIETTTVSENGRETTTTHMSNIQTGDDINRDILDLEGIEVMSMGF